jgi:septum formation protein
MQTGLCDLAEPARDLILASHSPRRRELLALFDVPFRVVVGAADAEEALTPVSVVIERLLPPFSLPLFDHPTLRAWRKLDTTCALVPNSVLLAADTIVAIDNVVLNKPIDADDAYRMLCMLSGRPHTVYTGIAVADTTDYVPGGMSSEGLSLRLIASTVHIAPLDDPTIAAYIATGEPLDKAGAYGIQGLGGRLVRAVEGSYTGVVGLPLTDVYELLTAHGIAIDHDPTTCYIRWLSSYGKEPLPCPPTLP